MKIGMKYWALGLGFILAFAPVRVSATAGSWSYVEAWCSTNYITMEGGSCTGVTDAAIETNVTQTYNGSNHVFGATLSATSSYTALSTLLTMVLVENSFPTQWVETDCGFTNTFAVLGPAGSGTVSYTAAKVTPSAPSLSVCDHDFNIKQDGNPVDLFVFFQHDSLTIYHSTPQPITFGQPFVVEAKLSSRMSFNSEEAVNPYKINTSIITAEFGGFEVRDAESNLLNDASMFTVVSEANSPYPRGSKLYVSNIGGTNHNFYWHSAQDASYSVERLVGNEWTNISGDILGTGTTNYYDASSVGTNSAILRLGTGF